MNVIKLNEYLSGNRDAIEALLEHLECANITFNYAKNEFRCSREEGKNPTAVRINVNSLGFKCYSTNEQGSIYNFVMSKKKITFPSALRWVTQVLDLDCDEFKTRIQVPFDGFYKTLIRSIEEPELMIPRLDLNILNQFGLSSTISFIQDGIGIKTQEKFRLGYDIETNRITIPQWDINGNLIGIMGRSNDPDIPSEYRWIPIIPCSRSFTLFGYWQNYAKIQQQQLCIITESEKGVMQLDSMRFPYGVATCTNSISKVQEKYIKALRVEKIIIAYDQGIEEERIRYEVEKLKMRNEIYSKSSVGYIFDKNGEILPRDSKMSPTDVSISKFRKLVNCYTVWE